MSNKAMLKPLLIAGVIVSIGACTGLPVKTDINPAMSGASCHTYGFADEHVANADQQSAYGNPLNADRLRQAIEANMAAKGIQKADDRRSAECVVGYAMGTRQVFDDFYGGWGGGWGGGYGWRGGWGWDGGPYIHDETRISVDLFDAKSRVPIWHASVSQTTYDLRGPHAVEKINAAAAAIFTKFPVAGVPAPGARSMT